MTALSILLPLGLGAAPIARAADDPPTLPGVVDDQTDDADAPAGETDAPAEPAAPTPEPDPAPAPTWPEEQTAPADPEAPIDGEPGEPGEPGETGEPSAEGEIAPSLPAEERGPIEVELAPAPLTEPEPGLEPAPSDISGETPAAPLETEPAAPAPRTGLTIGDPAAAASDLPEPRPAEKIPHKGAIFEFKSGVLGCVGALCADPSGHNAGVGLALDGFLGGNIRGFLDVGVEGGWGRLNPQNIAGRSLTDVYGFDIDALSMMIGDPLVAQAAVSALTLSEASMSVVHGGPALRLHVIPRGRVSAYIGTGAHYQQWRTRYTTTSGEHVGLTFHGTSFPLVAGLGFYPHRHLALGIEGRYVPSLYWIAALQSPFLNSPVPISALDRLGPVSDRLPSFWTMNATARVRF